MYARKQSQNHRVVDVGRDLIRSFDPTLLLKGHLEAFAQGEVQTAGASGVSLCAHCHSPVLSQQRFFSLLNHLCGLSVSSLCVHAVVSLVFATRCTEMLDLMGHWVTLQWTIIQCSKKSGVHDRPLRFLYLCI